MLFIIIILIILFLIIFIIGFNNLIPLILAICNFILSSLNLIINRNNLILRLIQLISLAYIIYFILYYIINLRDNLTKLSFSNIIYFNYFKYNRRCYAYNQRTHF